MPSLLHLIHVVIDSHLLVAGNLYEVSQPSFVILAFIRIALIDLL